MLDHHSTRAQEAVDSAETISVHNHGHVRLVGFYGGDATIVQAARVSYGKGTKTLREDVGLLAYLLRNRHWSPFEQVNLTFHVKLPIFVARQFIRHRTAKVNEVSARYSELPAEFYVPEVEEQRSQQEFQGRMYDRLDYLYPAQDTKNRQGRAGTVAIDYNLHELWLNTQRQSFAVYEQMLARGVARELARACLPLGTYTEWYWQIDLRNLLNFLQLRCDGHAQQEARDYAEAMRTFAAMVAPETMALAMPTAEAQP